MLSPSKINSTAMISEKLLRTMLNLLIFSALARSLGPEIFGVFGLVQAAFFVGYPVALFANQQILIKFLVSENRDCQNLQKQALKLKYIASAVVYSITIFLCYWQFSYDVFLLVAVYCLIHFVNTDIIYFSYFRAYQRSLDVLVITACVVIPFVLLKLLAIYFFPSLVVVVVLYLAEALSLSLVARNLFMRKSGAIGSKDSCDLHTEKWKITPLGELASNCWPIFTAAFLVTLYTRVDQFMIDAMLSKVDLGYYTSAVKISEASTIVITAYLLSRFPSLLLLKKKSKQLYQAALVRLMRQCLLFSILTIFVMYYVGELLIHLLYGRDFLPARDVLIVHMSGTLFIYYGLICTQWLVAEGLQIYRVYRVAAGLVLNVVLNVIFIPKYGIVGAAVTTVVTQAFSSVLFNGFSSITRPIFRLQIASIFLWKSVKVQK